MNDLLKNALEIATEAHEGQLDKSGVPYIKHPIAVSQSDRLEDDVERAAALLHDVIEDTPLEAQDLLDRGVPAEVVRLVDILSRRPHPIETHRQYVERVAQDEKATRVKLADMDHNTSPARRTPGVATMSKRYKLSYRILGEEPPAHV